MIVRPTKNQALLWTHFSFVKPLFRTVIVDVMIESFITVLRKNICQNFKVHDNDNIDIRQLAWLSLTFGKRG